MDHRCPATPSCNPERGLERMRLRAMRLGVPVFRSADSLFGRANSLFGQKTSLFPEEQGIGCKLLNPLGDGLPPPPQEAEIGRNLEKFPVNFPVIRESGGPTPTLRKRRRPVSSPLRH